MLAPWAQAGFRCVSVDVEGASGRYCESVRMDVRDIDPSQVKAKMVFSFPPCTHLASSGARHWARKGAAAFDDAKSIALACWRIVESASIGGFVENPRGRMATILGPSTSKFEPWWYTGYEKKDNYSKETRLWIAGRFRVPAKNVDCDFIDNTRIWYAKSENRSDTPMGFAIAAYHANKGFLNVNL